MTSQVTIDRLQIESYRGLRDIDVSLAAPTVLITGGNGTGKSTLLNAYLWTLWGVDQEGRRDYEVKPLDAEGHTPDRVDTSVTVTLRRGDETLTLRRTLRECWVKPSGSVEEQFRGNTTIYEVNGVPVKMSEYSSTVDDFLGLPASEALLLATPTAYLSRPWKDLRKSVIDLTGGVDPVSLLDEVPGARDVIGDPDRLDRLEKEQRATHRKLSAQLKEYQPRIDQVEKMKPQARDWHALEAEQEEVDDRLGLLDEQIEASRAAARTAREAAEAAARAALEREAEQRARLDDLAARRRALDDRIHQTRAEERRQLTGERDRLRDLLEERRRAATRLRRDVEQQRERLHDLTRTLDEYDRRLVDLRADWQAAKEEEYPDEDATCPTCGRPLPEEEQEEARRRFEERKRATLDEINDRGRKMSTHRQETEEEQGEVADRLEKDSHRLTLALEEVTTTEEQLRAEEQRIASAEVPDTPAIVALLRERDALTHEEEQVSEALTEAVISEGSECSECSECSDTAPISDTASSSVDDTTSSTDGGSSETSETSEHSDTSDSTASEEHRCSERSRLIARRDELTLALAERDQIRSYDGTIARLKEEARDKATELARVERTLDIMRQYRKAYIESVESRASTLCPGVTFRMYDYTLDGDPVETCTPLVHGVPYPSANTADRVNAGIRFVAAIHALEGTTYPLWVDGAESITDPDTTDGQMILLAVTPRNPLTVSRENGEEDEEEEEIG